MKKLFLYFLFGILCVPVELFAIGISVSPAKISVETVSGKEGTARFTVSNPSKEVGLFETYPEEFEKYIILIPSRFLLESGEKREVLIRIRQKEIGMLRTAIAIEAKPLGELLLGVGGGVRIPLSIAVKEAHGGGLLAGAFATSGANDSITILGVVLLLLLVYKKDVANSLRTVFRFIRQ